MRRTKTLKFEQSDPREKELYDYLQSLPHGTFSEVTKRFWQGHLDEGKRMVEKFEKKDGDNK